MAANGGDIVVQLRMEDGQFRVAVVQAGDLVRALKGKIDQTSSSVKKLEERSESLGRRFRDLVLTLGNLRFVAMDINDIFLRLPMSILKTAGELEKMQQLMTGLSKETDDARKKLEGMKDMNFVIGMAKNAPFDIQSLSNTFVKLKTSGIDPANGSMQALVDSVARFGGTGDALSRAAVAIQQMGGKGVISMEELRQQLGEAVPTAMQAMADGMNVTMAELAKTVSTGTLAAGPALAKMFLRMEVDNAGAAAAMMKTWVGMTSQLRTEWDLTAKDIADAGFMDASKGAVEELIKLLRSPEFKEFGVSFGQGLGEAVRAIGAVAEAMIKYREEIGFVIKAWLAYKLVSSGIAPLSKAIGEGFKSATTDLRNFQGQLSNVGAAQRAEAIASARTAATEAASTAGFLASKLHGHQRELQSVRQKNAAILAESSQLSAQLIALQNAERKHNANNIGEQERKLYRIEQLSVATRNLTARELELGRQINQTSAALNLSSTAAVATATRANQLAVSLRSAGVAAQAATIATKAFGSVASFMGGWVGITITAIGALVLWWNKVTDAAKQAQEAQRDAALGRTTAEQLEMLANNADSAAKKLKQVKEEAKNAIVAETVLPDGSTVSIKKDAAAMKADAAKIAAAEKDYKDARAAHLLGVENMERTGAERRSQASMVALSRELSDMEGANRQKIAAVTKQRAEFEKANVGPDGKLSKENAEKAKQFRDQENKLVEAGVQQQIARTKQLADKLRAAAGEKGLSREELLARQAEANAAEDRLMELEGRLKSVTNAITSPVVLNADPKKPKGPKGPSPFENLIEGLAADRARLDAEIEGLTGTVGKADKVAGAVAQIQQQIADGKFGKLSAAQQKAAVDAVRTVAETEKRKNELEKSIEGYKRVFEFLEGMEPEFEEAAQLLANPLGTAMRGENEKRVEKFLMKNQESLKAYAEQMGLTLEQASWELTNSAVMADAARVFGTLGKETKSINDSIVNDSRQAAAARARADNERHRQEMQNIIDKLKAEKGATAEIMLMQEALNANMAAREARVSEDAKGPMEKLAENWENATRNMEEASVGWANKTMDAMTDLVMTGKADFAGLAKSIIADIVRIQLQKAAAGAVSMATSWMSGGATAMFANGGIMTDMGSMPLKKYAKGGIANSPQMAIFGEGSQPEAYVPLPDGRSIPVTMAGGSAGQNVQINITVNDSGGSSTSATGDKTGFYRNLGEQIKGVVRDEMMKQARPGGMLYK